MAILVGNVPMGPRPGVPPAAQKNGISLGPCGALGIHRVLERGGEDVFRDEGHVVQGGIIAIYVSQGVAAV